MEERNIQHDLDEGSFDHSIFLKNYQRLLSAEAARLFFLEVYDLSRIVVRNTEFMPNCDPRPGMAMCVKRRLARLRQM